MQLNKLQGTDGIRAITTLSTDERVKGITPLQAFVEKKLLTEQFAELYAYATAKMVVKSSSNNFEFRISNFEFSLHNPQSTIRNQKWDFIVGWDPRDTDKIFSNAVIKGIRKAGCNAISIGILPTPATAIYLIYRKALSALMITASHNPKDQNGIKIFLGPDAIKPLPDFDEELTKIIYNTDYSQISLLKETGEYIDEHQLALDTFINFSIDPKNTWIESENILNKQIVVVDSANGCYSNIAGEVFKRLKALEVIEVNNDNTSGNVNYNSGVTEIEGINLITSEMLDTRFKNNLAIKKLFEIGRTNKSEIESFEKFVSALVFDADGDRLYRLDYNPLNDSIIVMSGDEIAVHQAKYLIDKYPEKYRDTFYVNTIESDINSSSFVESIGYKTKLTGVGDKWLLTKKPFTIACEESGHNITEGYIEDINGDMTSVFVGNGLKSAINVLVATHSLPYYKNCEFYFDSLTNPFPKGFKKTLYVYYTDKSKLSNQSFRDELVKILDESCLKHYGMRPSFLQFKEEPDIIYASINTSMTNDLMTNDNRVSIAGIFIRNSGTEDKTGINLRGRIEDKDKLMSIAEDIFDCVMKCMKNESHIYTKGREIVLSELSKKSECSYGEIKSLINNYNQSIWADRLLKEVGIKEGLLEEIKTGIYKLTERGKRVISNA